MNTLDFEQRVSQLERRMKRFQAATVMLGAALVGLVCLAAEAPRSTCPEVRTKRLVVVPSPSRPPPFHPQHLTPPAVVTAHVVCPPVAIAVSPDERPTTSTGSRRLVVVPSPRPPDAL